jgi:hypothetical protein
MPLIKARTHRITMVRHICRLKAPNRDVLVLYARFIGDTQDYVLNQLIETTIAKDREFVVWRAEHPSATPATSDTRTPPHTTAVPAQAPETVSVPVAAGPHVGSVANRGAHNEEARRP